MLKLLGKLLKADGNFSCKTESVAKFCLLISFT